MKRFNNFFKRIFEQLDSSKVVIIYPGRFHPAHIGHASVYKALVQKFPYADVFISTTAKSEPEKSPFSFEEKKAMLIAAGVPADRIVQTVNPYIAIEIVRNYDKTNTKLIFAVSEKDMVGPEARFSFKPKKDGSPSYFQPLGDVQNVTQEKIMQLDSFDKHGYIVVAPTTNFNVLGRPVKSASEVRNVYKNSDPEQRKQIITDLYGKFDPKIYDIFNSKLNVA